MKKFRRKKLLFTGTILLLLVFFVQFFLLFRIRLWSFEEFSMVFDSSSTYSIMALEEEASILLHRNYFYAHGKKVSFEIESYEAFEEYVVVRLKVEQDLGGDEMISISVPKEKKSMFDFIVESWRVL